MVMEGGGSGNNSTPIIDKTRVLDVEPLRTLVPVFPSSSKAPPFGPYSSGFAPFYPFSAPQGSQATPDLNQQTHTTPAAPLRSFRATESNGDAFDGEYESYDGSTGSAKRKPKSSSQKRARKIQDLDFTLSVDENNFVVGVSLSERDDGNREVVHSIQMRFDALRRRLSQLEDAKESPAGIIRRADLKAGNILMTKQVRTNMRKRIGTVPGVEIGDIFFFRMEMCLLGLHAPSMAGIDYMSVRNDLEEEPLAVSIVSSGYYDDDAEDKDVLIYSGQGGAANKDKGATDQKLERGNLALERSLRRGNEVRVIRGMKDSVNQTSKVYVYDGLFRIQESWVEKAKSGCNIFKYKLVRIPGQPDAFGVWKSIEKWREGLSSRAGLILPDLTSGAESMPVALVNDVDEEKGPAYFTYVSTVKYSKSFKLTQPAYGCNCRNACQPGNLNCSCIRKNEGNFPYTANGVLVCRAPMIHECGPTCPCFPNCKNRASQTGLKARLEVFKTKDRGWGLRSWDSFRAGTFICEYAGEVIEKVSQVGEGEGDGYVFDTTHVYESFKWNYEPGLVEEDGSIEAIEEPNVPSPLVISSKNVGNVARFMNHSCYPNVFWQPIMYENNNESFIHIAFFAMRHIPPMTELTFDYGKSCSGEAAADGGSTSRGRRKCLCGAPICRGYFG
ncbi:histone-lysine N-methyltransferase, H3 lysine-9 specific SUVH1-like [Populus nigra]|uniref:histone-lysine N-methyltransferase, H3 lysine-9 specific SUVH1-like n=1 Tax=Populus nigra TaxID=3691 RepID=UPI002B279E8B|nr:histone-lysine N-methyltransferase, H3 lysine-9 specific SUVH1-like [Populus nigra]